MMEVVDRQKARITRLEEVNKKEKTKCDEKVSKIKNEFEKLRAMYDQEANAKKSLQQALSKKKGK